MVMGNGFVSFEKEISSCIQRILSSPRLHGLWLNTLSYFENCGARKIASCEHPTAVKETMLKHAAEEFRHAFYLKSQLARIGASYEDYRLPHLLGGWTAYQYLNALDLNICRHLKARGVEPFPLKQLAYVLVTYAIELRASELYPIYQSALKSHRSKVQVQSILLEEKEHLQEMEQELHSIPGASSFVEAVCELEAIQFQRWLQACVGSIKNFI
jgi:hypothetical protein